MRIFLIGMPGSGKTHWMKQLATVLDYDAIDMDVYITEHHQKSIPELFAVSEEHFREKEQQALLDIIAGHKEQIIISTGGGAPMYGDNMQLMKANGCVVYIDTSITALVRNVSLSKNKRPLLTNNSDEELVRKLNMLYRERQKKYEEAHIKIDGDNISLATFAAEIKAYIALS